VVADRDPGEARRRRGAGDLDGLVEDGRGTAMDTWTRSATVAAEKGSAFLWKVYAWMCVFFISARATQMTPPAASGLFALYSALNGVTLSVILLPYTGESIATTFLVTSTCS
jgi:FtsH-binding integral membrane protein